MLYPLAKCQHKLITHTSLTLCAADSRRLIPHCAVNFDKIQRSIFLKNALIRARLGKAGGNSGQEDEGGTIFDMVSPILARRCQKPRLFERPSNLPRIFN